MYNKFKGKGLNNVTFPPLSFEMPTDNLYVWVSQDILPADFGFLYSALDVWQMRL